MKNKYTLFLFALIFANNILASPNTEDFNDEPRKSWTQSAVDFIRNSAPSKRTLCKSAIVGLTLANNFIKVANAVTCPPEMPWKNFLNEKVYGSYTHGYEGDYGMVFVFRGEAHYYISPGVLTPLESFQGMCHMTTDLNLGDVLYSLRDSFPGISPNKILKLIEVTMTTSSVGAQLICNYALGYTDYPEYTGPFVNITCSPFPQNPQ